MSWVSVAQGQVCVCTASLVPLFFFFFNPSVSKSVISALVFTVLMWKLFGLAAAHLSCTDLIDLKIFNVKKNLVFQRHPFWMLASLPLSGFLLSAWYWAVLASAVILCWKIPKWTSVYLFIRRGHSIFYILHLVMLLAAFVCTNCSLLFFLHWKY